MFNSNDVAITTGSVLVGLITLVPLALGVFLLIFGIVRGRKAPSARPGW